MTFVFLVVSWSEFLKDEVYYDCWRSNPNITEWMIANNMSQYNQLEAYYSSKVLNILKDLKKKVTVWQGETLSLFLSNLEFLPYLFSTIDVYDNGVQVVKINFRKIKNI